MSIPHILTIALIVVMTLLAGCTGARYVQECVDPKSGMHVVTAAETSGFAYLRTIDGIDITSEKCGRATVAGAKTDTEKAWEAGLQAGKAIAGVLK